MTLQPDLHMSRTALQISSHGYAPYDRILRLCGSFTITSLVRQGPDDPVPQRLIPIRKLKVEPAYCQSTAIDCPVVCIWLNKVHRWPQFPVGTRTRPRLSSDKPNQTKTPVLCSAHVQEAHLGQGDTSVHLARKTA